jgi:uncharacterized protein
VPEKLKRRVERCHSRIELEYLYEPFRPPRKTPGWLAREQGLEPLAVAFLKGEEKTVGEFLNPAMGVQDESDALHGVREILAERFSATPDIRLTVLRVVEKEGVLTSAPAAGKETIPDRFRQFRKFEERLHKIPSHRYLALRRAETEGALSVRVEFPDTKILAAIAQRFFPKEEECSEQARKVLDEAAALAIRHMRPAVLEDALTTAKDRADFDAINVFTKNLYDLLLFPPAGPQRVMGVDPAPRGAIPFACIDENGQHLEHARLKLFGKDEKKIAEARETILRMVRSHSVELVALGNGQGRHECEAFLSETFRDLGDEEAPAIVVVNEVGAGSYASGRVGRAELPALPVPVRGAVTLARRLIDPLPELVKVDPRQIGVGQYQNDVDEARLSHALDEVVEHCVNYVGIDLNRAPVQQLACVCGLTTSAARLLVEQRDKHGAIPSLEELRNFPFISETAFRYSAGFLRIHGGRNALDTTGVHPDLYPVVDRIAKAREVEPGELVDNTDLLLDVVAEEFADENSSPADVAGVLSELLEGGRDPRPPLEVVRRPAGVHSAKDLEPGMQLGGRVTNVTNFGAFVDIGVQQDGLVHVSELSDYFVKDATSVVKVGQVVQVKVLGVDSDTGRISLTMKSGRGGDRRPRRGGDRDGGRGGDRGRKPGRGPGRGGGGGGGGGGRDGGGGRGRPRRDGPRDAPVDREYLAKMTPKSQAEQPPVVEESTVDPVPADMSEEEYMKRKLEELKKRFG